MLSETLRAAALLGMINQTEVDAPLISSISLSSHELVLQQDCAYYVDRINCANFEIRRTTPNATTMVDVIPRVYNWKNWRQWQSALTDGWEDGLDLLYTQGCNVINRSRNYTNAHMTVTVGNPECTKIAPDN